jgi:hypothetical protein
MREGRVDPHRRVEIRPAAGPSDIEAVRELPDAAPGEPQGCGGLRLLRYVELGSCEADPARRPVP